MKSNILFDLLQELLTRIKSKSPKLFVVIQWIALLAAAITGLPYLLQEMGIELGMKLDSILDDVVFWASTVTFVVSKLPVLHPEEKKLPITNKVGREEPTEPNS